MARVAVWKPMPDDDRQWVIDAAKTVPGVLDAYHLIDPTTGEFYAIAFFEDDVDIERGVKAVIARKADGHRSGTRNSVRPPSRRRSSACFGTVRPRAEGRADSGFRCCLRFVLMAHLSVERCAGYV